MENAVVIYLFQLNNFKILCSKNKLFAYIYIGDIYMPCKKFVFFYAIFLIAILFVVIGVSVKWDKELEIYEEQIVKEEKLEEIKRYEKVLANDTVRLKITSTDEIIELDMNEYLRGVVPSEMPPYYHIEALKAQAIVARTYAYQKMETGGHSDCDICDSATHCQAYYSVEKILQIWERRGFDEALRAQYLENVNEAVYATNNTVVTYNGELIRAYFHANSGGKTENVSAIWGKQYIPYLIAVESLGEENHDYYKTDVTLSKSELQTKLNNNTSIPCFITSSSGEVVDILSYTDSGRVDKVSIGGSIYDATQLRTALGLKSTNFTVDVKDGNITFHVTGYGHGVGMSQTGANYYGKEGYTANEIIQHYYTGVDITRLNVMEE